MREVMTQGKQSQTVIVREPRERRMNLARRCRAVGCCRCRLEPLALVPPISMAAAASAILSVWKKRGR